MGEINNVPDTPYQSPLVYNASGIYTGSNSTVTSGVTVMGEWIQLQKIPYFFVYYKLSNTHQCSWCRTIPVEPILYKIVLLAVR